jgi:hypothetical protein
MSEREETLILNLGDNKKLELTPDNTTVYTFMGRTAVGDVMFENASANHAFVQTGKNEQDQPTGMYFFERFHPVYSKIAQHAIKNSFPILGNQRRVPECDIRAYMGYVDAEQEKFHATLEGVFPEDFTA